MAKASDNPFPSILLVKQAVAPATPASGQARLYRATDGKQYVVDDTGAITQVGGGSGGGSGQGAVSFKRAKGTSADIILTSATMVDVDPGMDLVLPATVGDVVECMLMAVVEKQTTGATYAVFDFHTIVGGSPVNSVVTDSAAAASIANSHPMMGSGQVGNGGAFPGAARLAGIKRYTVVAGDISAGTVRFRLRGFVGAACILRANDPYLYVQAINLGQQL